MVRSRSTSRPLHALLLPTGPALVDALRAALAGGPAVLPIDPATPRPQLDRLIAALRPAALVTADGVRPCADAVPVADDVSLVIATSGSTGEPKGVELTTTALRHSAAATLERLDAGPADRWLCCLPTSHIAGLQVLVRSLLAGTDPLLHPRFDVTAFADADAEFVSVVPTMLRRLLDAAVDLAGWRTILLGGATIPGALLDRARAAGATVVTTYGMSETCGGCVYDGVPLTGVGVGLRGDGRVVLSGPMLAERYRLRPDLTAEAFTAEAGRALVTRDIGRWTRDGRLEVLGRADDVIVTGGVNVAAAQVADVLAGHPAVADVAVLGAPDDEWGERVVAVVVPRDATAPPTLDELRAHVRARAPREYAPRQIVLADAIPLLGSGKPDRAALRALAGG